VKIKVVFMYGFSSPLIIGAYHKESSKNEMNTEIELIDKFEFYK